MQSTPQPSSRRTTWYIESTAWRLELIAGRVVAVPVRDSHRNMAACRQLPEPRGSGQRRPREGRRPGRVARVEP
jgi:hypothetical protein